MYYDQTCPWYLTSALIVLQFSKKFIKMSLHLAFCTHTSHSAVQYLPPPNLAQKRQLPTDTNGIPHRYPAPKRDSDGQTKEEGHLAHPFWLESNSGISAYLDGSPQTPARFSFVPTPICTQKLQPCPPSKSWRNPGKALV